MIWLKKFTKWWRCGRSTNPIISTNRKLGMNDVIPTISTTVPPHVPCIGNSVDKQNVAAVDLSTIPSITVQTIILLSSKKWLQLVEPPKDNYSSLPRPQWPPVTPRVWFFFKVGCLRGITHLQLGVLNHPSLWSSIFKGLVSCEKGYSRGRQGFIQAVNRKYHSMFFDKSTGARENLTSSIMI